MVTMRHALAKTIMVRKNAESSAKPKVTKTVLNTLTGMYIDVLNVSLMMRQITALRTTENATLTGILTTALKARIAVIWMSTQGVTFKA